MDMNTNTNRTENPFETLAAAGRAPAAQVIALAFRTAHREDDVFPAIRMARLLGALDQGDYFGGRAFNGWMDRSSFLFVAGAFDELKELAWAFNTDRDSAIADAICAATLRG